MRQLLDSDINLLVVAGTLYVPLRFDPSIAAELKTFPGYAASPEPAPGPPASPLRVMAGRPYLKAMSLLSLAKNYKTLHPEAYEELRRSCLGQYRQVEAGGEIPPDPRLSTIIFEILPHFIKLKRGRESGKPGPGDILEVIARRLAIDPRYYRRAQELYSPASLRQELHCLEDAPDPGGPPPEGLMAARDLKTWVYRDLARQIMDREKVRLKEMLAAGEQSLTTHRQFIALQLYMADQGFFEIDGCGVSRHRRTGDYLIYKRTGEYALKDYYGRVYRFPDCRVAVTTQSWLRPVVLERYKHPLLYRYAPGQQICIRQFTPAPFTAANVIRALEEGLSALYYGYNSRRRNGYHSLDRITEHYRAVDFSDYVIPRDDPRLISGELKVTNSRT
jgi:hypothetical protein